MSDLSGLTGIFPEVKLMFGFMQRFPHHKVSFRQSIHQGKAAWISGEAGCLDIHLWISGEVVQRVNMA